MLNIRIPNTYIPERNYILQTLIKDFLGMEFHIYIEERCDTLVELKDVQMGKTLCITDILFQTPNNQWLTQASLPEQPLSIWDTKQKYPDISLVSSELPIIYGKEVSLDRLKSDYLLETPEGIYLGIDIFGSAFFMLTRYEEYVKPDRDEHDRFPSVASLAYQEQFLDRPIINEYIEILWYCMKRLWPDLERKKRNFRIMLSHDVDVPFAQALSGLSQLIRNCGGDIVIRKSLPTVFRRLKSWHAIKKGDYKQDLNYTFDQLMEISEQHNLKSAFYFKTAHTNKLYDNTYSIDHPYIRQLIRDINDRGHEIGFHSSYETYQNPAQTKVEFKKLMQVCEEEGINQNQWGGRQHYLRWQVPITWRNWEEAGLDYDSTLTYADHAGFRCGVCYEFPVFDLERRQVLSLWERPLIIMEGTVLECQYMKLLGHDALSYMRMLKERCQQFNGDFTLLWHNSSFLAPQMWEMYQYIIKNQ